LFEIGGEAICDSKRILERLALGRQIARGSPRAWGGQPPFAQHLKVGDHRLAHALLDFLA
jgi:hypothetical protein